MKNNAEMKVSLLVGSNGMERVIWLFLSAINLLLINSLFCQAEKRLKVILYMCVLNLL